MEKLTERQAEVLEFIKDFILESGMPPTRADIARALGFRSANAAEDHLKALARKEAIELIPGSSRGIRLPEAALIEQTSRAAVSGLPLVGRVAAGEPILASENVEDHYNVEADIFQPRADYLLRVSGLSMKNIGIFDGDLLAVHRTADASNGQIVVARVEDEVTVKRYERRGSQVLLHAENEDFQPIKVDLSNMPFTIEGLGVGVIRTGRLGSVALL